MQNYTKCREILKYDMMTILKFENDIRGKYRN